MITIEDGIRKITILAISAMILVSPIIIATSKSPEEPKTRGLHKISFNISSNSTKIITLPSEPTLIETKQNIKSSKNEIKPNNNIITNNKLDNNTTNIIYDDAYEYEIYKKGGEYDIRFYVPAHYYESGKRIENEEIEFDIYYENSIKTQHETQNPDYDYVIITNETLYPVFKTNFVNWKLTSDNKISSILLLNVSDITINSSYWVNGTWGDATVANPWIPAGKQVTDHYLMFNDTQAKIRNFLRDCNTTHNTKYVLLAGNKDVVPPRIASSRASGDSCNSFDNDLSHASDLYYSCLDYCMNNNTNQYWMENPCCGAVWDEVDYGIDLHVGRVLVSNESQTMNWINKTKNYVDGETNAYKYQIVACKDSSNNIDNQSWTGWDGDEITSANLNDEFPVNMTFINGQNISQAQWIVMDDYVNGNIGSISGINIIYHTGHGGTLNNLEGGTYNSLACNNYAHPNFVYTEGCHSGDFEAGVNTRAENWIRDDGCMVAGVVNSAYGWFVASTYFGADMMSAMFNDTRGLNQLTFCEAHDFSRENQGSTTADGVWAMIFKESNFFGDPALDYKFYDTSWEPEDLSQVTILDISNKFNNSFIYTGIPSFNWTKDNNASLYSFQIANDSAFTDLVINISDLSIYEYPSYIFQNATEVRYNLPSEYELKYFNKYYVRVKPLSK